MLQRLRRGDAEGDYRRHWLLTMALEDYFALRPGASDETIAAWMAAVIDEPPIQPIDPA